MKPRGLKGLTVPFVFLALLASGPQLALGAGAKKAGASAIVQKQPKREGKEPRKNAKSGSKRAPAKGGGKKIGREFVFDGSTVNGQYHSAGEAVAKVEQEKKMNDLVGMRRDFKDRLGAEKERLQRGDEP